jgi:hypothetical protein
LYCGIQGEKKEIFGVDSVSNDNISDWNYLKFQWYFRNQLLLEPATLYTVKQISKYN